MRVIYDRLYEKMKENDITARELAAVAGVNVHIFWLKLRGLLQWKLHEVVRICCFFRITDAEYLFSSLYSN